MKKRKKCRTSGKIIYLVEAEAQSAADYLTAVDYRPNLKLHVYRCPHCRHYHLTKREQQVVLTVGGHTLTQGKDVR